jgi:aryl-alcohol dehydrogenase-like predicted oxidoreductase
MGAARLAIGELSVSRLGLGTMSLTGAGVWGDPRDPAGARTLLRRARELGVDFFDTADSYGPGVAERLLRESLHPYEGIVVATKGGLTRQGPGRWDRNCRPEHLRSACEESLRRLGVDRIDLYQLHTVDPAVPLEESLGALLELQAEGKIGHVGVCNVGLPELELALRVAPIVSVQNRFSLADRTSEPVLELCDRHGLAFLPWAPLAKGFLTRRGGRLRRLARAKDATPGQLALAWLLRLSPNVLPIPGTASLDHLEENLGALEVELSPDEAAHLERQLQLGLTARRVARRARVRAGGLKHAVRRRSDG